MKNYYNWAKSQPGKIWDKTSCMEKVLDHWVQGMGKEMKQGDRTEGKSVE